MFFESDTHTHTEKREKTDKSRACVGHRFVVGVSGKLPVECQCTRFEEESGGSA